MNVPASRLSVDPDDPGHLVRWLLREGQPVAPDDYIERGVYGRYLEHVLSGRGRRAPQVEVEVVRATVTRIDPVTRGFEVTSSGGGRLVAPRVVLAVGVPEAPSPLPIDRRLAGDPSVVEDPWAPGALDGPAGQRWLVAGTGLTMVDVALTILRRHGTTVDAVSRHGLLPRVHPARAGVPCTRSTCRPVRSPRRRSGGRSWTTPRASPTDGPRRWTCTATRARRSGPACPRPSRPSCSAGSGRGTCTATAWPPRSPTGSTPSSPRAGCASTRATSGRSGGTASSWGRASGGAGGRRCCGPTGSRCAWVHRAT